MRIGRSSSRHALIVLLALAALAATACSQRNNCPTAAPVGVEKPPPANPITEPYTRTQPSVAFETVDVPLEDAARKRNVPVHAYIPTGDRPAPVIIFSHGLGSSRMGYAYLGTAWASAGYISIHVEHVDSNADLSLYTLYKNSYAPQVLHDRPRDISFVIDALEHHDPRLERIWSRADLTRIAVAGHSLGAQTALHIAGVLTDFEIEKRVSMADPRVKAVVDLSPPWMYASPDPAAFAPVHVPVLHMAGTDDENPAFDTLLCHKRVPFDWIHGPSQYLVMMNGAVHRSFAGEAEAQGPDIEFYHSMIVQFTTAFWDAMLRDDPHARDWLDRVAPPRSTIERK